MIVSNNLPSEQVQERAQDGCVPAIRLSDIHLRNCRVVGDWEALLHLLPHKATVAEVGVDTGRSSEKILRISEPRKLHLIDIEIRAHVRTTFAGEVQSGLVEIHESDSVVALRQFPQCYFDWIFIDGDHSPAGVRRDAEIAEGKIKPGGLLVFDDYIFFDHAAKEFYGVIQTVNRLCVDGGWEIVFLALQEEMFCKAVIRKRV